MSESLNLSENGRQETLQLRHACSSTASASAWLIPEASPESWLSELVAHGLASETPQLMIVAADGRVWGLLVTELDQPPAASWIPYASPVSQLYVPLQSSFMPPLDETELQNLLRSDVIRKSVWHPRCGLIGFEESQILSVSDLVSVSLPSDEEWDSAQAGAYLNYRLVSVAPSVVPDVGELIDEGRDDIGRDAADLHSAPRSPEEGSRAGQAISGALSSIGSWLRRQAARSGGRTGGAASPGFFGNIFERASQSKRMNELQRLMSMLKDDPDKGLRYAIPFGGGAPRGLVPGGNELISHGVDYGAGGGGGPAGVWDVPWELQIQLRQRYQDLAQRELSLGRHRRAAYIYATLLDDLPAAASALESGGYYQDAAAIWRDRLKSPVRAAECYLAGGMWEEAVQLFEGLRNWHRVAEIHERLENEEEAAQAWRNAEQDHAQAGRFSESAQILEERLSDTDGAIARLDEGWLDSQTPGECLDAMFSLQLRHGREDECLAAIDRHSADHLLSSKHQRDLAGVLANLAQRESLPQVSNKAFHACRGLIARHADSEDQNTRREMLSVYGSLIPEDKLLARDCRRMQRATVADLLSPPLRLTGFRLKSDVRWQACVQSGGSCYAAGYHEDTVVVARWHINSEPDIVYATAALREERQGRLMLVPDFGVREAVYLHIQGMTSMQVQALSFDHLQDRIRSLDFADFTVIDVASDRTQNVWTVGHCDEGLEIRRLQSRGVPMVVGTFGAGVADSSIVRICPLDSSRVGLVINRELFVFHVRNEPLLPGELDSIQLPGDVVSCDLLPSQGNRSESRLALTFDDGGFVYYCDSLIQQQFATGLTDAFCFFRGPNQLVAAGAGQIELYSTRKLTLSRQASRRIPAGQVLGTYSTGEIHARGLVPLIYVDGRVEFIDVGRGN